MAKKGTRKCPRCGIYHTWPTEDKLCKKCEAEWVEECDNVFKGRPACYSEKLLCSINGKLQCNNCEGVV